MFLKQGAYKPRSNSQSSKGATGDQGSAAAKGDSSPVADKAAADTTKVTGSRRRSSGGASAGLFNSLNQQKRNSVDQASRDFTDQNPRKPSMFSETWNKFTKGS